MGFFVKIQSIWYKAFCIGVIFGDICPFLFMDMGCFQNIKMDTGYLGPLFQGPTAEATGGLKILQVESSQSLLNESIVLELLIANREFWTSLNQLSVYHESAHSSL